jgi:DNA-binding MurR/RpiR family transcriptional regulator
VTKLGFKGFPDFQAKLLEDVEAGLRFTLDDDGGEATDGDAAQRRRRLSAFRRRVAAVFN